MNQTTIVLACINLKQRGVVPPSCTAVESPAEGVHIQGVHNLALAHSVDTPHM